MVLFFIVSTYQRPKAEKLDCIFADLVNRYKAIHLRACGTSELQTWQHADSPNVAMNLLKYHTYISKLVEHHTSLATYSICQTHYNQVINTNQFYQHIVGSVQENKRSQLDDLMVKLDRTKRLLESVQIDQLQEAYDNIIELQNLYSEKYEHIETLTEQ
ncbi:hypothetical protein C2G38_2229654 [Gigaspora rosea]|uniref:Uncharacterized protein n=1 Tax=Gigaspora rosea TaxID=44941 RepID=A0A397TWJ1_9GLOM|nr:hypothetical protein C2G38_2229654 [Gigaspora rosea]